MWNGVQSFGSGDDGDGARGGAVGQHDVNMAQALKAA